MKDLIYRQDAIDALEEVDWYHQNKNKDMVLGANPSEHQAWYKEDDIFKTLEALPSAQPEKMQLSREDATFDCISRQAAIDFIDAGHLVNPNEPRWSDNEVVNFLKSRPSAQPEIIRCKDCKHKPTLDEDDEPEFPTNRCPCQCDDFYYSWMPKDDWFCGNAEGRTDE